MPKFLTGCHYNEEEISRHFKKKHIDYWPVQINSNKFATGQILGKPVEVVKGADFSWLSLKASRTLMRRRSEAQARPVIHRKRKQSLRRLRFLQLRSPPSARLTTQTLCDELTCRALCSTSAHHQRLRV